MQSYQKLLFQLILAITFPLSLFHCGGGSGGSANPAQPGIATPGGNTPDLNFLSSEHPRIILTKDKLEALRQKAKSNSADWIKLKSDCDQFLGEPSTVGFYEPPTPLYSLALCYQILLPTDKTEAEIYAKKAKEFIDFYADPAKNPKQDAGYGIRFAGVGMSIGYDWLYTYLTAEDKTRIYTALNRWIDAMFKNGEQWNVQNPIGNYYAGYYAAKGLIPLATRGENPRADEIWNDFYQNDHLGKVQKYFSTFLVGGGWPEGWGYGPLATFNMILPTLASRTALEVDLIRNKDKAFLFPLDQAKNLTHFSWPNLLTMDDRGTHQHQEDNNSSRNPVYILTFLSSVLTDWNDDFSPVFHSYTKAVRTLFPNQTESWISFLFWNENFSEKDYQSNLPKSYLAPGMNALAIRSSWEKNAVWGSFVSGGYTNVGWSGEQYFDQGSLAIVKGGEQFLVNAPAALTRFAPNSTPILDANKNPILDKNGKPISIGTAIYENNFHDPKTRTLYNIFYADTSPSGQNTKDPNKVKTAISRFEEGDDYVIATGSSLEEMYGTDVFKPVSHWTRELVYLRPNLFILFDRTQAQGVQWLSFYLAANPAHIKTGPNDTFTLTSNQNNTFIGKVSSLFPVSSPDTKKTIEDPFNIQQISHLQIKSSIPKPISLTVFDASSTEQNSFNASRLTQGIEITQGDANGVFLENQTERFAVIFSNNLSDQPISGDLQFKVPNSSSLKVLVSNLPPNSSYILNVQNNVISLAPNVSGTLKTTAAGVLYLKL